VKQQATNIIPALSQCRKPQLQCSQAMPQGGAEESLSPMIELCIGRRDNAHIHRADTTTRGLHLSTFQSTQQLRLHSLWSFTNLVHEQGTAVGTLEVPGLLSVGTGVGTAPGTEQFRSRQLGGNRRHIDGQHIDILPQTTPMNRAGHQFLTTAGLAQQKNRRIAQGQLAYLRTQFLQDIAFTHKATKIRLDSVGLIQLQVQYNTPRQHQHQPLPYAMPGNAAGIRDPFPTQEKAAACGGYIEQ
jgi:hypothetical protein